MNMISTGAFLTEMDAPKKENEAVKKLVSIWEKKNSKMARASGVSLMALTLAACGDNDDTPFSQTDVDTAVTAALTGSDGTVYSNVDAAVTAGANSVVDTTPFNQADIDAAVQAQIDSTASNQVDMTISVGDYLTAGTGDNTIVGVQDGAATETFSATDTIDGGDGNDTIIITNSEAAALNAALVRNVENVEYRGLAGGNLDMANFEDATSLLLERATGAVDVDNLATTDTLTIKDGAATMDSSLTYTAAGVTGTADSATVTLDGVTALADIAFVGAVETMNVNVTSDSSIADLDFDAGTTALNITAGADLTVTNQVTSAEVAALSISGAGDVTLTALDASTITVSAGSASGDLTLVTGAAAEATDPSTVDIADITVTLGSGADSLDVSGTADARELSVDLGAGDDTVTLGGSLTSASTTSAGDIIVGGDGTDTISVTSAIGNGQAAYTGMSGFEAVSFSNALAAAATVANYQAGLNTVTLAAGANAGTLNLEAGSNTVNIGASLAGQLTVNDTGTATTDALTIANTAAAADDMGDAQDIVIGGFETVNLVTTNTGATEEQNIGAITMTADTGGTTTLNLSGTNAIDAAVITADVLNASGLTAQAAGTTTFEQTAALVATATGTATITGSAGDDILVGDTDDTTNIDGGAGDDNITGGADAETISGGDGDDVIAGGGGADTISGGAGGDTITLGGTTESVDAGAGDDSVVAAGNVTFGTTLVGGDGTDSISVSAAVATAANGSVVSGFETLTLAGNVTQDLDVFGNNTFATVSFGTNTITVQSVRSENITITAALAADATITMEDATGTADSATITISSAAAVDTTNDILVAGVETINLVMTDTNTTAHQNTVDLGADSATAINLSGSAGAIFATGGNTDIADVITMDASGITLGAVTDNGVTYAATYNTVGGVTTLTGSNGVDSLTGGAATSDTLSGGGGIDTLVYTGGSDTLTGGDEVDVYDINALGTSAAHATVTTAAVGETIDLVGIIDGGTVANVTYTAGANWQAQEVTLGSSATLANYLDAASAGDGNSGDEILTWFEFGGNSYIVMDNTAGATFAATDGVVQISGTTVLDDASAAAGVITIA